MNPLLRNILAGVAGAIVSMPANMLLLGPLGRLTGAPVAPLYDPLDPETTEAVWRAYFDSLEAVHMVGPLLAHWNGAFCGALVAGLIAAHRGMLIPLIVAGFVLLGGIANAFVLPGQPPAFLVIDILGYLPVGWLGWKLALGLRPTA
jgi:hypothetical protein